MTANRVNVGQFALTGVAQQLPSEAGASGGIAVKALPTNTGNLFIGEDAAVSATSGFPLAPGEGISLDILQLSRVWVFGTAGDRIAYLTIG